MPACGNVVARDCQLDVVAAGSHFSQKNLCTAGIAMALTAAVITPTPIVMYLDFRGMGYSCRRRCNTPLGLGP